MYIYWYVHTHIYIYMYNHPPLLVNTHTLGTLNNGTCVPCRRQGESQRAQEHQQPSLHPAEPAEQPAWPFWYACMSLPSMRPSRVTVWCWHRRA